MLMWGVGVRGELSIRRISDRHVGVSSASKVLYKENKYSE